VAKRIAIGRQRRNGVDVQCGIGNCRGSTPTIRYDSPLIPRCLPDDVGIASKLSLPQTMAEDDDQRASALSSLVVQEASSGGRYPSTSNPLADIARRSAFLRCRPRPGLHSNSRTPQHPPVS